MTKRSKRPRAAKTYRAARRNAVRAERGVWRGVKTKYFDWLAKPPIVKFDWSLLAVGKAPIVSYRERVQPKTYKPNGKRECARRIGQ